MDYRYIVCGIVRKGDEIILGKKAKGAAPYPDVWHTPGGGANDFELAQELYAKGDLENIYFKNELRREIKEELGIEIENIRNIVPEYRSEPRQGEAIGKQGEMIHFYFLEYLCDYADGELRPGDDLAEAKWVRKNDLKNIPLTPPSQEMYQELGWI
ncbi:MAG: NUDIX domain-containing protein [Parcubacteria group bacterium]